MFIYSKKYHEYSVCVLDALTVDAYQKIAKIADRKVNVRSVVGKSVAAGIIPINQEQPMSKHKTHFSCFTYCLFYSCFIF